MKKKVLAIALVTVFTGMGVAQAADVTAQAVATWSATAKKDTTSKLVVTPLGSLAFQYAEGIKGFNSQKGLFDVAIEGDSTATAFKLTSRLITNTLTQLDTSGSTLNVGVDYNGAAVEKTGDTVMIDTANGSLTNTGNATLRILAYGPCLKAANGKECKENYYLMPGKSRRFTRVDTADNKGRVALWQGDKFIPVK